MGLIKPFFLGFAIVSISCHVGLRTTGGTQGVGRATTNGGRGGVGGSARRRLLHHPACSSPCCTEHGADRRSRPGTHDDAPGDPRRRRARRSWCSIGVARVRREGDSRSEVSFTLIKGHTKIILGASGAGKSTILKLILGLLQPDEGVIWVNGERVDQMSEKELMRVRADLGMVFQEGALFDSLTVRENVGYKLSEELHWPDDQVERARRGNARVHRARSSTSTRCRRSCRAGSAGAWRLPVPWPPSRASCCTTSRPPGSIPSRRRRSTKRSSSCVTSRASARSSSRTSCAMRSTSPGTRRRATGTSRIASAADEEKSDEAEFIMLRDGDIVFEGPAGELRRSRTRT